MPLPININKPEKERLLLGNCIFDQQMRYRKGDDASTIGESSPSKRPKLHDVTNNCEPRHCRSKSTHLINNSKRKDCIYHSGERQGNVNLPEMRLSDNLGSNTTPRSGFGGLSNNKNLVVCQEDRRFIQSSSGEDSIDLSRTGDIPLNTPFLSIENVLKKFNIDSLEHDLTTDTLETPQNESPEELKEMFTSPKDECGNTELHRKILEKDEIGALRIIRKAVGFEDLNVPNKLGQTPIHLAVISGQPNVLRKLMSAGALVSNVDVEGNTPLHLACQTGQEDLVRHLLTPVQYDETTENRYKIPPQLIPQDLEVENDSGDNCLQLAVDYGHPTVLKTLIIKYFA